MEFFLYIMKLRFYVKQAYVVKEPGFRKMLSFPQVSEKLHAEWGWPDIVF